ncbi:hypothetical protein A3Q56_04742 [Intoshia linei]|uniref:Ion transport domain-containing protein n=1 Tax=Intoshia linei TaxID=1819745 RepID=A0A177B1J6_9BILA|nr:hypothetical protein A3Q56_04742 [Intoshia linei]
MIGLTLFVGVVIANYSENKGTALLTVDQKRWKYLVGRIKLSQPLQTPPRPIGKINILRMLMKIVMYSVIRSFFIIAFLATLIITYGLMGTLAFASVKYGEHLNEYANFQSTPNSLVTLYRIITGEDWNKIMHDCFVEPPYCTQHFNYWESDCGHSIFSLIYFCSYYVIITYISLNLLVAIIIENFSLFYSNDQNYVLSYNDIVIFQNTWNIVDTQRKGFINAARLKFFFYLLHGRLEIHPTRDKLLHKHMCYELRHFNPSNEIWFHDVLMVIAYRSVDIQKALQFDEMLVRQELEATIEESVAKEVIQSWLRLCFRKHKMRGKKTITDEFQESKFFPTQATMDTKALSTEFDLEAEVFAFSDDKDSKMEIPSSIKKKSVTAIPDNIDIIWDQKRVDEHFSYAEQVKLVNLNWFENTMKTELENENLFYVSK